jgi:hypothetical protein
MLLTMLLAMAMVVREARIKKSEQLNRHRCELSLN